MKNIGILTWILVIIGCLCVYSAVVHQNPYSVLVGGLFYGLAFAWQATRNGFWK